MSGLRILFVASREPAYSRVDIVQRALMSNFEVIPVLSSASSYPARFARVLWRVLKTPSDRYDTVFVGFFAQPLFPFVRLLSRKPIISDAYFSIYDTFISDKGLASKKHPLAKLCLWLDRQMLRHSRLVFSDTEATGEYLRSLVSPPPRIPRLWISAQPRIFQPLPPLSPPTPDSGFRILFYGGFIPLQGADIIVRAAALLRNEPVHFELVGSGQTFTACRDLDRALRNTNTTFHGWKSQAEILKLAAESHLILGIFGSSDKAARVIPNKVYEGLAMAKPVLTGDSPAIRELLTPGDDVITCRMNDAEALADAVKWCLVSYPEVLEVGARGCQTFKSKASPDIVARILQSEITRALGEPESRLS
ncbi:MAG: glycosyltransferase [Chthoniobacterales bacterium]